TNPAGLPIWRAAAAGEPVDWPALFAGYAATVDWPGAAFWRPLLAEFPSALVILTVRDAQSWYDSVSRTIFRMFGDGPADEQGGAARGTVPGRARLTACPRR